MTGSGGKKNGPGGNEASADIVGFPQSKVRPPGSREPYVELGYSEMSIKLGILKE